MNMIASFPPRTIEVTYEGLASDLRRQMESDEESFEEHHKFANASSVALNAMSRDLASRHELQNITSTQGAKADVLAGLTANLNPAAVIKCLLKFSNSSINLREVLPNGLLDKLLGALKSLREVVGDLTKNIKDTEIGLPDGFYNKYSLNDTSSLLGLKFTTSD